MAQKLMSKIKKEYKIFDRPLTIFPIAVGLLNTVFIVLVIAMIVVHIIIHILF